MTRSTSLAAYRRIMECGELSERRKETYDMVYKHGPITANEIYSRSETQYRYLYRNNFNSRLGELVEMGLIEEVGKRECKVKKTLAYTYVTTNADTVKPLPKRPKKLTAKEENEECALLLESKGLHRSAEIVRSRYGK